MFSEMNKREVVSRSKPNRCKGRGILFIDFEMNKTLLEKTKTLTNERGGAFPEMNKTLLGKTQTLICERDETCLVR